MMTSNKNVNFPLCYFLKYWCNFIRQVKFSVFEGRLFKKKSLPRVRWRVFSSFSCCNRQFTKKERWNLPLTASNFLVTVSLGLHLNAGSPGGSLGGRCWSQVGSAGKGSHPFQLLEQHSRGEKQMDYLWHFWPRRQAEDRQILNPSYPNSSRCFTNGILQLTNALLSFVPPTKRSLPTLQPCPVPWAALQRCFDITQWTWALF